MFRVPKSCKKIYVNGLKVPDRADQAEKDLCLDIRLVDYSCLVSG